MTLRPVFTGALALALAFPGTATVQADAVGDFYSSNRIRIIAAAGAGGGFGLRARLLADRIGRHMPGKPSAVAEFMPGAGGRKAANYIYSLAPKDGTTFGVLFNNTAAVAVIRPEGTRYDPRRFTWLGSQSPSVIVLYAWHTAPARTVEDIKKTEIIFGTQAKGGVGYMLTNAANTMIGTRFKIVTGYQGTADYLKAIEAGEIHSALADWDSIISVRGKWVQEKTIVPVMQFGLEKHPTLPGVPRLIDLVRTDTDRRIAEIEGLVELMGHTNVAPPDVPADRTAALRKGIAATYRDAAFRAAAARVKMTVEPISAEDVEKYVKRILATPPDLLAKARVAFGMN